MDGKNFFKYCKIKKLSETNEVYTVVYRTVYRMVYNFGKYGGNFQVMKLLRALTLGSDGVRYKFFIYSLLEIAYLFV